MRRRPQRAALTPRQRQLNIDSFEYVWTTIRDKHWQSKPAGLDWQAVHDELRPAIEKASTMEAARAVLNDMLGRLHQTHFAIIPSDLYSDLHGSGAKGEITTGIDVRVAGSGVLVSSVEPRVPGREGRRPARLADPEDRRHGSDPGGRKAQPEHTPHPRCAN